MKNSNRFFTSFALVGLFALVAPNSAHASTFVGNGGNAGDVEWLVTLQQIQAGVDGIEKDPPEDETLCSCNETYSHSAICDALNSLSREQRRFCGETLKAQLPQLKPLVRDNRTVHVSWTRENIDVLEDGGRRAVDAVTDPARGKITLNAEQFRSLNPSERVFLISHELMHLTKLDGKLITDEGPQGPFTSNAGSRQLINAMAAALVIETDEAKAFSRFQGTLNRPQGWKTNWIDLSFTSSHPPPQGFYGIDSYNGVHARFTHYFTDLGVNAEYATLKGSKKTANQIQVDETSTTVRAGLSYRFFLFKDPLTLLGQSNLVVSADVDFISGEMELNDTFVDQKSKSNRVGGSGQITYYFPVFAGLWLSIAESYESLPAPYTIYGTQISNQQNQFATYLGASYAF